MKEAVVFAKYTCDQGITSVRAINKLLYLSFVFFGNYYDKFLFEDRIGAWDFAPVVSERWYWLKTSPKAFATIDPIPEKQEQSSPWWGNSYLLQKAPYLLTELREKKILPSSQFCESGKRGIEMGKRLIVDHYKKLLAPIEGTVQKIMKSNFSALRKELVKT